MAYKGFPGGSVEENLPVDAGDARSIHGLGNPPGVGKGSRVQNSCQESPMNRRTWRATGHGVAKSWTRLSTHTAGGL